MVNLRAIGLIILLSFIPLSAVAHHGVSGQFDTSQTFEASGKITQIRLVNPHAYVYFDVKNGRGDVTNMRCELLPGSTLKRKGWSEALFVIGSEISVIGSPDRDDPTTCYMNQMTFANGVIVTRDTVFTDNNTTNEVENRQIVREDGRPNLEGNWAMSGPEVRGGEPPQVTLTTAGQAAVANASSDQNPRFNCQATNIIMDWWFNQNVNAIKQSDTEITLAYGFMDLVRTIHLDGKDKPMNFIPSRAGYSTGQWDGDVLVVTTSGFDEGWISAPLGGRGGGDDKADARPERSDRAERPEGADRPERPEGGRRGPQAVKNSAELIVTERFMLNEDGTILTREYAFVDPLHLVGAIEGKDAVNLTAENFAPYDCEDLTDEEGRMPSATHQAGFLSLLENSFIGKITSTSIWGYPIFLALHAIGMAIMVGISLMLIIRVLGFGAAIPVSAMISYWYVALGGFVINLLSGTALFFGNASELFFNWAFWTKLGFVVLSLILTWRLVRICVSRSDDVLPGHRKLAGVAMMTWIAAIIFGRLIGYMS